MLVSEYGRLRTSGVPLPFTPVRAIARRSRASSTQIGFIDDRHGVLFGANLGDHLMAAALYFSAIYSWAGWQASRSRGWMRRPSACLGKRSNRRSFSSVFGNSYKTVCIKRERT
jgi:hypothetical protein